MSFADQSLVAEWLWEEEKLEPRVYEVPRHIDETVARLKLDGMGIEIDVLTEEQERYLTSWKEGTV